jgi:hypothetical protein
MSHIVLQGIVYAHIVFKLFKAADQDPRFVAGYCSGGRLQTAQSWNLQVAITFSAGGVR